MKLPRRSFLRLAAGAAALPAVTRFAWAQAYPTRPVKIVVPVGPSGSYDIVGRALADQLAKRLDQTVVVENRAGAGTVVGTQAVIQSPADGYTLLVGRDYVEPYRRDEPLLSLSRPIRQRVDISLGTVQV